MVDNRGSVLSEVNVNACRLVCGARRRLAAPGRSGVRWLVLVLGLLGMAQPLAAAEPEFATTRVQLAHDPNRGVPYVPLATLGGSGGPSRIGMAPWKTIELDGNPLENVYSNLLPIDVDGDGTYEFVQFNGFRFMQVWSADGRKLWRINNPDGRLNDMTAGTYRDTAAVLDLDGDGGQDIAHCWEEDGRRMLVYRRGRDGAVIRKTAISGVVQQLCSLGAVRMAPDGSPQILVAGPASLATRSTCSASFVGYWSHVTAFDLAQRQLWDRNTCNAGHYIYPLDQDLDGRAEAVFVGKYLFRPDGSLQCSLAGWAADDHVDGIGIADIDPGHPGLEVVAVGRSGVALFEAATCRRIWTVPTTVIRNPQHVAVARLDPSSPWPQIVVDERGNERSPRTFILNGQGRTLAVVPDGMLPMQNANLDGATGSDEVMTMFGTALDLAGNLRLTRYWYWRLQGSRVVESLAGPYPRTFDRWQAFPLVFDYDGDGRDELVQWGQSLIVIGKARR